MMQYINDASPQTDEAWKERPATWTTPAIAANGYLITPFTALSSLLFGVWSIIMTVLTF